MRRLLFAAALGALLVILVAAPAGAAPPNEVALARHFAELGLIPSYATPEMALAAVHSMVGGGPRYELKSPLVQRSIKGKKSPLARYLARRAADPSATATYTTKALVLLVEFGDGAWPAGSPAPTGPMLPGPGHGAIPAPAPDDNKTFWPGDFSRMHYQQLLFGNSHSIYDAAGNIRGSSDATMRNYYLEQSHSTFTVSGDIGNWVKLDMPESWYGADSDPWNARDDLTGPVWRVARDAVAGFAAEHPDFPWSEYDNENPYGITGDNFHQADGYVDHLILIHAGSDEADGGGAQGPDAIWSHSWGILQNASGGPGDGPGYMVPGTAGQGPQQTGIWVYPYTINPEDGAPGVFDHEFAHDLGLPDEYDYSSATGDTSASFWTLMCDGENLGRQWGLVSDPGPMNVWDKYALGFVTPKTVRRGTTATVKLQPAAIGAADSTGVIIPLPKRKHIVELSGKDGALEWYSNRGDNLDNRLTTKTAVAVPSGDQAVLTLRTWYDIEEGYDYGYVWVSEDNGTTWTTVQSAATVDDGTGNYGLSGTDTGHWQDTVSYDLSAYAGKSVLLQFRYVTDVGVALGGWEVTDVQVGGISIVAADFTTDAWLRVDGRTTTMSDNYYIAEYRTHDGSDAALKNCNEANGLYATWEDWYSYNQGLHLIYRDTFWQDNDVGARGGGNGAWNVVDARPLPDGVAYGETVGYWRPRIQVRDAAFSVKRTPSQSIWFQDFDVGVGVGESVAPGKTAQPWFNDAWTYWFPESPEAGTKIPQNLGVRIQVRSMNADGMTIWVDNKK
ncbi:MAG: immune inhibitor A [Actinobacteria bacterium]|nr:immune inhibitor A [Actinomycetota bacterium]